MILPDAEMNNKPLVTFALFAYNQEKYIEKAIKGALSQTYLPLEIIISDDGSSDQTFNIAESLASSYKGPHRLCVRRNDKNIGIGAHIKTVIDCACGEIIVMAAGDDVSHPDRSKSVVDIFLSDPSIYSVFTDVRLIDEESELINSHSSRWDSNSEITLPVLVRNGGGVGIGASYAYRRECFDWPWKFPDFIVSEDRLLPLRALCLGGLKYLPVPLVDYRISKNSLSAILTNSGKLAAMNNLHMIEVNKTLNTALNEKKISKTNAKISFRIIKELPVYNSVLRRLPHFKLLPSGLIIKILDNWINRHDLWIRIYGKIKKH